MCAFASKRKRISHVQSEPKTKSSVYSSIVLNFKFRTVCHHSVVLSSKTTSIHFSSKLSLNYVEQWYRKCQSQKYVKQRYNTIRTSSVSHE